jgi:uncharacterized iron-regulated membrane protein
MENEKRKQQAKVLRTFRKVHRITGALLFAFFFIVAITGLLLGWKKQTGLLPKSAKGISAHSKDWLPIDNLQAKADAYLLDSVSPNLSLKMDRIDIRPDKGMVKFVYADHYWGLQLDCTTGELLQIDRRVSDFIEQIHDGSIIDHKITGADFFKLIYTSIMGVALLIFTITGFWLWYGPKRMRKMTSPQPLPYPSANRQTSSPKVEGKWNRQK